MRGCPMIRWLSGLALAACLLALSCGNSPGPRSRPPENPQAMARKSASRLSTRALRPGDGYRAEFVRLAGLAKVLAANAKR